MVEFNPDGSLKVPESVLNIKKEKEDRLKNTNCLLIKKEAISFKAPKKCVLHLQLSEKSSDPSFIEKIYRYFAQEANVITKISKITSREYDIEIGTDFKRCSECTKLIGRYKEFLDNNVIEEKGNCEFESFYRKDDKFCYEDYFE